MDWDNPTEEQIQALLKIRGGCCCAVLGSHAPCSACTEPPTAEETMMVEDRLALAPRQPAAPHECERVDVGFGLRSIWACKRCGRDM